jgi:hypothetical protein
MGLTDHKSQGQHYDEPKDYLDHKAEEWEAPTRGQVGVRDL